MFVSGSSGRRRRPPRHPAWSGWHDSAVRINLRAGQWVGILIVLVSCGLLGFVLPSLAERSDEARSQTTDVPEGTRVSEGGVSVVLSDGWARNEQLPGTLLLYKEDATFTFNPPVDPAGKSPSDAVAATADLVASGPGAHMTAGDPTEFTTASGLPGAQVLVASPENDSFIFAFTTDTVLVSGALNAPPDTFTNLKGEIDDMMQSVEIDPSATPVTS